MQRRTPQKSLNLRQYIGPLTSSDFSNGNLHVMGVSRLFTARKRSLRRLCFYRCVSVHGGGGGFSIPGGSPSGGFSIWGGSPSRGGSPSGGVLHPVNVRAVRILLECILVNIDLAKKCYFLRKKENILLLIAVSRGPMQPQFLSDFKCSLTQKGEEERIIRV